MNAAGGPISRPEAAYERTSGFLDHDGMLDLERWRRLYALEAMGTQEVVL
jgi:hypothetical protein